MSEYETKDSGERAQFDSGMQRDTQSGKARFDLTQPKGVPYKQQLLTRFAELMGRGADKYSERNWEKATGQEELDRFLSSAFRHFMQWYAGERDEDHAAAVLFNIMGYEATSYKMSLIDPPVNSETPTPLANCRCVVTPVEMADEGWCLKDDMGGDWWYWNNDEGAWQLDGMPIPSIHYVGFDAIHEIIESWGVRTKQKPPIQSAQPSDGQQRSVCAALAANEKARRLLSRDGLI